MDKREVAPLANAYRLLNPGCVVLISVGDGTRDNLFAVTWNMPAKKEPGMCAFLSGKGHHSYPFIVDTREFAINIVAADLAPALYGCGTVSGRDEPDKWQRFALNREAGTQIAVPVVAEAVANLECRVNQMVDLGSSSLIIGEILAARADRQHFDDNGWRFDKGLRLLHHLGGKRFCVSGEELTVR
ncbi:MAG: hypothetical protein A2341_14095 [Deltaproteobacteria bacterium RIFOXYB12_FULL_58_9]|nr:MAG: hypothetical protein A2341_14095 [Deltaproteobacteria bacterium RIFOXYB12_FULL_58_9]